MITIHRAKDSVTGGPAGESGSAGAKGGKPTASQLPISKSFLSLLEQTPEPSIKPNPKPAIERMPEAQLLTLKNSLASNQFDIFERTLCFLKKNASELHPDDLSELYNLADNMAFNIINSALYCESIITRSRAVGLIKALPINSQLALLQYILNHEKEGWHEIMLDAIPLIKYLPESHRPALYNSAYGIINSALYCDSIITRSRAVGLIKALPIGFQNALIQAALGSRYSDVREDAQWLIK